MKKLSSLTSSTLIPGLTLDLLKQRLMQFGPPAAAGGAALAGVSHLLSLRDNALQSDDEKKKDNTLVIQIPQKEAAGPSFGQYVWDSPLAVGSTLAGGAAGYAIIDGILKKYRQKQMNQELDSVKGQYASYLGQELAPKQASEYPTLDGILIAIADQVKDVPVEDSRKTASKNILQKSAAGAPTAGTMLTSMPGVAALLAGVAAHQWYYNRQKDVDRAIEKEEADGMQKSPQYVKIVSQPPVDPDAPKLAEEGEGGGILEGGILASLLGKSKPKAEVVSPTHEPKKVFSNGDVSDIAPQTVVLSTEGGPVQVDALDPKAVAALQGHKDQILKSFALGANVN